MISGTQLAKSQQIFSVISCLNFYNTQSLLNASIFETVYIHLDTAYHFEVTFSLIRLSCGYEDVVMSPRKQFAAKVVLYLDTYVKDNEDRNYFYFWY